MTELSDDQVFGKQTEMSDDQVFGDRMPDALQTSVPEAFLDRVRAGQVLSRITMSAIQSGKEGLGTGTPTGFEDETLSHLMDSGVFHDPTKSRGGPIQMLNEATMIPAAKLWEGITRATSAGIHGAGGAFGQIVQEFGQSEGEANRAKNEVINAGNWAMIEAGMGRFSRPAVGANGVVDQAVGGLPKPEDFSNAAKVLAPEESATSKIKVINTGRDKYDILDHEGKRLASADVGIVNIDGKKLAQIDDIYTPDLENVTTQAEHDAVVKEARHSLGTGQMREAMRQFLDMNPDVEGFTGNRVSGARNQGRMGPENIQNITVNLRRMWQEDGIHPAEAVHDAQADAFLKHDIVTPQSIIAYHGSPHDFEAFSTQHIGAGEGAQAYGHGLYFAEKEGIARHYRDTMSDHDIVGAEQPKPGSPEEYAFSELAKNDGDYVRMFEDLKERRKLFAEEAARDPKEQIWLDKLDQAIPILENWEKQGVTTKKRGSLYQVRISADQSAMLDWDKPLSEQPQAVKDIVKEQGLKFYEPSADRLLATDESQLKERATEPTGAEIYQELQRRRAAEAGTPRDMKGDVAADVSSTLNDAGIPGIKYLDQGSRDAGEGTRNFVIFNEGDVQITHKNGQPIETIPNSWGVKPDEMEQAFGKHASLSAAITPPEEIPLDVQPASPPGSLIATAQAAGEKLFDVGHDIQMKLAPMARGTVDSMATVKDYMNSMRRNAWDVARVDTDLTKRFTPESLGRMANAMEEESLSLRLGEPASAREHQGLNTLEPEERAAVVDLNTRQQLSWLRARDLGMVEGEGVEMHFPRMVVGIPKGLDKTSEGAFSMTAIGYDLSSRTPFLKQRKHLELESTERAIKEKVGAQMAKQGKSVDEINAALADVKVVRDIRAVNLATKQLDDAIAGRTLIEKIKDVGKRTASDTVAEGFQPDKTWFTVDHPSFKTWRPKFQEVEGKVEVVKTEDGKPVFEQVPIYVRGDFEGPLRSAMWGDTGAAYSGLMALKGKTMGLIMNSPAIHNMVEFGRAFPAMPTRIVKAYFDGNRAKNDPAVMHEAIDSGLVPIGKRFFNQDINSIMESPDLTPGRSWTAKVLAAVPGLFDEAAGTAVKRAIDKAGDFWHNTLLWDRIGDLQAGLYVNFRGDLMAKGMDQQTASRVAAHWANRYAGALPKEAMSESATKVANFMMFSRSFTLGNLGVMKDMVTGLPKDVLAQIERDAGFRAGALSATDREAAVEQAVTSAKSMARRKAISVVLMDVGLMYVGNSVLQSAFNVMLGDHTLTQEGHDYLRRMRDLINEGTAHPLQMLNPFHVAEKLSATNENEPNRKDRVLIGYANDGTAIYGRNPVGKIGEEFSNWFGSPIDMLKKKEGTIMRPLLQIFSNDAGFGRKIYDPDADTAAKYAGNIWAIVKHLGGSQLPVGQMSAMHDLVTGDGDPKVNALQAFGPIAGFTFSKGAPGGPQVGEMYAAKSQHEFQVNQALPDIRRQIKRGDIDGAISAMTELDIPQGLQKWYVKTTLNPALRMSPRAVKDFYLHATEEQRARFDRAQQAPRP